MNYNKMSNKFDFLSSVRFWKLFLIGLTVGLNFPFPNNPWVQGLSAMIGVWFGGSVAVDTFDKMGDKRIEAAEATNKVTTVSIPSNVSTVTASVDSKQY